MLIRNKRGQALVEFVLLLVVICGISYGFVAVMNRHLAKYWEYSINLVKHDNTTEKSERIP